ncbi:MAG: FAD-dependent oxidoreductase [Acidimicrobiales bacterium]
MSNETTTRRDPDVAVVGGGLGGLAAAATVARAGRSVAVYERLGAFGGQARSVTRDDFTFNNGPHALYLGGAAERVLTDLGVELRGGRPPVKGRVVFDDRAEIAPAGPGTLLRSGALSPADKLQIAKVLYRLPKLDAAEFAAMTVDEWIASVVTRTRPTVLLRAIIRLATYVNQPDQLSADVAITQLQAALGPGVLYLDGGWQSLVDQLAATPGIQFVSGEGPTTVPTAPAVIVATGGPATAGALLDRSYEVGPPARVSGIDYGLTRRPVTDVVIGGDRPFYFSNHSAAATLSPDGCFHAAAVQYLATGDQPDPDAIDRFARHAGVRREDVAVRRQLRELVPVTAIPTASTGGMAGRPPVTDTGRDNTFLVGDWVGSEGHLADAVLASAATAAQLALDVVDRATSRTSAA